MLIQNRSSSMWALFVAAFLLIAVYAYWNSEQQEVIEARKNGFNQSVDQIAINIDRRLAVFELTLRGVKGFVENSNDLSRNDFRNYFQTLHFQDSQPGFQGIAIAKLVKHDDLYRHLFKMREFSGTEYKVHPLSLRSQYVPIILIEPFSGKNVNAIGFDIASNPQTEPALQAARDTGNMALSSATRLIQDAGENIPAAIMYLPIYTKGKPLNTVIERRSAISAWVSGPFRIRDLIEGLKKQLDSDIGLSIYEGTQLSPENKLYGNREPGPDYRNRDSLFAIRTLNVGGKQWTLAMYPLPEFDVKYSGDDKKKVAVIAGVLISILIGFSAWILMSSRQRALSLASSMTQELRDLQIDQEAMLDALPDLLFELDLDGRYIKYRTSRMHLLAAPPEVFLGKLISDVLPKPAATICLEALREANRDNFSFGKQIEISLGEKIRWFELSVARKDSNPSELPRFVMISRDVTERRESEEAQRIAAAAFDSQQCMLITNLQQEILRVNKAFTSITGFSREEAVGNTPAMLASSRHSSAFYAAMMQTLESDGGWSGEMWIRRKNGDVFPAWLTVSVVKDGDGLATHYVAIFNDVSEHAQALAQIDALAFYDPLTQLPNRRLLLNRLEKALQASTRHSRRNALLFIDLDKFKVINDTLGHSQGDLLLIQVAQRLRECVRDGDTVSRLGGDEFVVLLEGLHESVGEAAIQAEVVAQNILSIFQRDFQLDHATYHSTPSIGITLFGGANLEVKEQPLKRAELAMFEAKAAGRNIVRFFDSQMQADAFAHAAMEADLRDATAKQMFSLYYQPQVVDDGRVIGVEALVRWQDPKRGLVSPALFIPLAEETGLILPIGQWVLDQACTQLAEWSGQLAFSHLTIAVNVSASQFQHPDFVDWVLTTLERTKANPKRLKLELTESMLVKNVESIITKMGILKAHGISFSLDDFGTGYSSLAYLKRLPLDQLKIDQGFVAHIVSDPNDAAIAKMVVALAESMGLSVIAEGVELRAQADLLAHMGCHAYQGYLYSKPLPIDELENFLQSGTALVVQ